MDKKGAIGITLTWITAFIIIFFIMLLFITASGLLASEKVVKGNLNEINLVDGLENMEIQRELNFFLNMPFDSEKTMKQEIVSLELSGDEQIRERIINSAEDFLQVQEREKKCYLFEVKGSDPDKYISINSGMNHIGFDVGSYAPANTNLFVNNQKIKITLYTQKC